MAKPRLISLDRPVRLVLTLVFCVMVALGFGARSGWAAPLQAVAANAVTIPAGGTANFAVQAIALNQGGTLPTSALNLAAQPVPNDNVRTALYYGIDWGYTGSAPYQVALAVWQLQTGNWAASDHVEAQRIVEVAANVTGTPSWNPDGTSLLTLAQSGRVTISPLTLSASAQNGALGSGNLQVTNNTDAALLVYLPYGTLFGEGQSQALIWAGTGGVQEPAATVTAETPPPSKGGQQATPTATTAPVEPGVPRKGNVNVNPAPSSTPMETATALPTVTLDLASASTPDAPAPAGSKNEEQQPAVPGGVNKLAPGQGIGAPVESEAAGTGARPESEGPIGSSAAMPESVVAGPVLPGATPTTQPAGNAAQPVSTTVLPQAIDTSVAPQAVDTSVAPQAVDTSQPGIPNPVNTALAPMPVITGEPVAPSTPTPAPTKADPPSGSDTPPSGGKATVPPANVKPTEPPATATIILPGSSNGGGTTDNPGGIIGGSDSPAPPPTPVPTKPPAGGGTAIGEGAPPTSTPATGGGKSFLTSWLSIAACLMVLGGWALRRKTHAKSAEATEA